MKHIPYATPDSPQSKYYVLLEIDKKGPCSYTTAWQYGGAMHDPFPEHWYYNFTVFKIGNYKEFNSKMIHSNTIVYQMKIIGIQHLNVHLIQVNKFHVKKYSLKKISIYHLDIHLLSIQQ